MSHVRDCILVPRFVSVSTVLPDVFADVHSRALTLLLFAIICGFVRSQEKLVQYVADDISRVTVHGRIGILNRNID